MNTGSLILNVGMNSNSGAFQGDHVLNTLRQKFHMYPNLLTVEDNEDKSNWGKEQTAVMRIEGISLSPRLLKKIEGLCEYLQQDCIALTFDGVGQLIFNPDYEGERFEFNTEYFKTV